MALEIVQIPVLQDNYVYLIRDDATGNVGVVDPAVVEPVERELAARSWSLDFILNTHHHPDHVGGNLRLQKATGCHIVGPLADKDRIPGIQTMVGDGDVFAFGESKAQVFDTPGHTRGHIVYYFAKDNALFCGDTLFAVGCGRLFEGTPQQMWDSLLKIRALPDATQIYCAHEYTLANLAFARSVEPGHVGLKQYEKDAKQLRAKGQPTIPANLGREKQCNPFLRADDPDLSAAVGKSDAYATFAEVRARKDSF